MKVINKIDEMRKWSADQKNKGRKIAFVPTMGALHEGHLSLMREGKKRGDVLVISIYVNPTQFGPNEDLNKYPRMLEDDLTKTKELGVDAVFVPTDDQIYPDGFKTYVNVEKITEALCGASRPTHFQGVTTVVAKLFNIVEPDISIFGEKDYQQLVVIQRMVCDLNMPVEIIGCTTVREPDGLAMSSRNKHLSTDERSAALSINRSLKHAHDLVTNGETDVEAVLSCVRETISCERLVKIDYVKIVDAQTLEELSKIDCAAVLAIAAFVGKTRLIDNICL